jgi:hypothetical protein
MDGGVGKEREELMPQSGSKEKACLTAGLIDVLRCPGLMSHDIMPANFFG